MKKTFLNASLALCTVGAAVWAVGVSEDAVLKLHRFPPALFHWSMIIGGVSVGIGLCVLLCAVVVGPVQTIIARLVYGDINSRYAPVKARNRDLPGLHAFYRNYFGDDVPSIDLMRSWIARSSSAFILVHRITHKSGLTVRQQLVGSFKLLPLTIEARNALDAGQVTGSTFRPEHVASKKSDTVAYYVGDVVATSQIARGMVLAHLTAACGPAVDRGYPIYARPLTTDGLRVMTKYGFVQARDGKSLPQLGRICKLQIGKAARRRPLPRRSGFRAPLESKANEVGGEPKNVNDLTH